MSYDSQQASESNSQDDYQYAPVSKEPIPVVYRDEHFIAVNKPAGLLVHRAKQTPSDEPVLLQTLRDQIGQFLYPAHRLDRPTSGLIIFGLCSDAAAKLVHLFTTRQVTKKYLAFVRGFFPEELTVDMPLRERFGEEQPDYDETCHPEQQAVTRFYGKRNYEIPWPSQDFGTSRYALVEAVPETGRWHQIRRHLKHIAHPIIGDHRHGDNTHNHVFEEKIGLNRMLLAAIELKFVHPYTREPLSLQADVGPIFSDVLAQMDRLDQLPR